MTKSSKNGSLPSDDTSFDYYESLVSAEIELIQRVNEIRQHFSSLDSERIIEPILQRILKIKSEKLNLEKKLNLI
ncbi:MAG: hypothetical protein NZ747_04110 [Nitrosopumilus sp.]|nr:hypothetical protein [Nitrosopumilus sp.]|tara:strand:- start:2 stop:226 length:225 start_codon:yes stop_codon:yes gene_type:complete